MKKNKILDLLFYWGIGTVPSFMVWFVAGILAVCIEYWLGLAEGTVYDLGFWTGIVTVFITVIGLVYLNIRKK